MYDILMVIHQKGGSARKTHILYKANLSYSSLQSYLHELKVRGLLEEVKVKGRIFYKLTEKGEDFLKQFQKLKKFAEAFGISIL